MLVRYRAEATLNQGEPTRGWREAEQYQALAQEVGAYREALAEIAEARRRWHDATELVRQGALAADAELRRRHPKVELPPLHPGDEAAVQADEPDAGSSLAERAGLDVDAALRSARQVEAVIAERDRQVGRALQADEDLSHRRELEAEQLAAARRNAVRQDPAPSHQPATELERDEPGLEAER